MVCKVGNTRLQRGLFSQLYFLFQVGEGKAFQSMSYYPVPLAAFKVTSIVSTENPGDVVEI